MKAELVHQLFRESSSTKQLDENVQEELFKEILKHPSLIPDEEERDRVLKVIISHMSDETLLKQTESMSVEERAAFVQDVLKHAGGELSEEAREKLVEILVKDAVESGDQEALNTMVNALLQDMDSDMAGKVIGDLMRSADTLDSSAKHTFIENILHKMDDSVQSELKQEILENLIKNLDGLTSDQKEEIMGQIMTKVAELAPETREKTIRSLMDNMEDIGLSSTQKNTLLQTLLQKVEENDAKVAMSSLGGEETIRSKGNELKNELIREILKNSKNLDESQRVQIIRDVMERAKLGGQDGGGGDGSTMISDVIMQELVSQMDALPQSVCL